MTEQRVNPGAGVRPSGPDGLPERKKTFGEKWLPRLALFRKYPVGTAYLAYWNARRLPRQTVPERTAMEEILLGFTHPPRIFEWGSGRSTRYYSRFLRRARRDFSWDSVDHTVGWHHVVRGWVGDEPRARLHCVPYLNPWLVGACDLESHPEADQVQRYIDFPGELGGEFDLLFVDGRFRRRCVETAFKYVKPGGFVLLHDAQRSYYRIDESRYRETRRVTGGYFPCAQDPNGSQMWIGTA